MSHRLVRRALSALIITIVVTGLAAAALSAGAFAGFQRRATDALFPSAKTDPRVVVIGMDQKSERVLGQLPWPRSVHAQLANQLAKAGVAGVVWDVVFGGPAKNPADDLAFAAALRNLPAAVLAETGRLGSGSDPSLDQLTGVAGPEPLLAAAASGLAHAEVLPDPADGVVRELPAVVEQGGGSLLPALSLAALQAVHGEHGPPAVRLDGVRAAGRFIPTE